MASIRKTYFGTRSFFMRLGKAAMVIFGFLLIVFGRSAHIPGSIGTIVGSTNGGVAHADVTTDGDTPTDGCVAADAGPCGDSDSGCDGACDGGGAP